MKKKILSFACLVAVLVSVLTVSASATAQTTGNYLVGYKKVDMNPWVKSDVIDIGIEDTTYTDDRIIEVTIDDPSNPGSTVKQKMVAVPLAGYSNAETRLSTQIMDDNGDGVVGLGDGVFATCTSVTDENGKTLIFITLDSIGAHNQLVNLLRTKIVSAIQAAGGVMAENQIMVSASHTHESPDLDILYGYADGTSGKTYFNYVVDRITQAATDAYLEREEAVMTKGSVSARTATAALGYNNGNGFTMNSVRHYYMRNGKNGIDRQFLGSNEFNNFDPSNAYWVGNVADADDMLHILQFERANKEPVLFVNWRAHSSMNGSSTNTIISSDYINSLRYELEQAGYCVNFFQGAAGNINPRDLCRSDSWHKNTAFKDQKDRWALIYGQLLSEVSQYCLDNNMSQPLQAGPIRTQQTVHYASRKTDATVFETLELNAIALGKYVTIVTSPNELFDRYDSNYETNYLRFDVKAPNYGTDRHFQQQISIPYTVNEWDNLIGEDYGTPFVFGYSNARNGYVPNKMAFDYNKNVTVTSTGGEALNNSSYETNTKGATAQGEGEKLIAKLDLMLESVTDESTLLIRDCEHCGLEDVQWEPLDRNSDSLTMLGTGHYYLAEDIVGERSRTKNIKYDQQVCIYLNGKTIAAQHASRGQAFSVFRGSTLNIMDDTGEGKIIGRGMLGDAVGGTIYLGNYGELNIYGGAISFDEKNANIMPAKGGVIALQSNSTFRMYDGEITGGVVGTRDGGSLSATGYGAAIYAYDLCALHFYGGKVTEGYAESGGSCVYLNDTSDRAYLYNDAQVDNIMFRKNKANGITVAGPFTGKMMIVLNDDETLTTGSPVAKSAAAELEEGSITCAVNGLMYYVSVDGRDLVLADAFGTYIPSYGWYTDDAGNRYYYRNKQPVTGWLLLNDLYYYFDASGVMKTGWVLCGKDWYYMGSDGVMKTGWLQQGSTWYYLDPATGRMHNGIALIGSAVSKFHATTGVWQGYVGAGWQKIGGYWYYTNSAGQVSTGWKLIGGVYYYFKADGKMATGWLQSGGTWYYLNSSGAMVTGWLKQGSIWYYLRSTGAMATGWQSTGGVYYFFNTSGAMQTGWLQQGSARYYLKASGAMATGWCKIGNDYYYFKSSGNMHTGWLQQGNDWYYLKPNGIMTTGICYINDEPYFFNASGVWVG